MEFRRFNWPNLRKDLGVIAVKLEQQTGTETDLPLADAIECGLDPESSTVWAVVSELTRDTGTTFDIVVIGDENTVWPTAGPVFGIEYPKLRKRLFLRPWHTVIRLTQSPTELHQRWKPGYGSETALLNIEQVEKKKQLDSIWELIVLLGEQIVNVGGRPKGSMAVSEQRRQEIAAEARRLHDRHPNLTWEEIAARFHISLSTLERYLGKRQ